MYKYKKYTCYSLLLKSGPPGVLMAPGRTPYMTFINEFDFLLGCYSNVDFVL